MNNYHKMTTFLLLIFLWLTTAALADLSESWKKPYFISMDPDQIELEEYNFERNEQKIYVWEEIATPYRLVQLNYEGKAEDIEFMGSPLHAGAQLVLEGDRWYINFTNRLDYEQQNHRIGLLVLSAEFQQIIITIELVNILDNPPVMSSGGPCHVNETLDGEDPNFLSDCQYTVRHADGFVENEIQREETNKLEFVIPELEATYFQLEPVDGNDSYEKQFKLRVLKQLVYTERAVYNFQLVVYDLNQTHSFTLDVVIQVQNVESRAPIFIRPFTTQRIPEKSNFSTTVTAIDGDTGLDKPVCYSLATAEEKYAQYFDISLDETGKHGILTVKPINRDVEQNEFYQFTITAYKCHNESYSTHSESAIILDDLNDNEPVFDVEPRTLRFWENMLMELPFSKFDIEDIDLGTHATYDVKLNEKVANELLEEMISFSIIPNNGYQLTHFTLSIVDASLLDYEVPARQKFELIATATERADPLHTQTLSIAIELRNWNDEIPAFSEEIYYVSKNETIAAGEELLVLDVTDRDIDDDVELEVLGRIQDDLTVIIVGNRGEESPVPTFTFQIIMKRNDVFDWDVTKQVIIQLQAEDRLQTEKKEPLHKVFAQIEVEVLDVNNKQPSITLPRMSVHIDENSPPGTAVSTGEQSATIIGTDPDSDADLHFSIDWENSRGMKTGQPVFSDVFSGCLDIKMDASNRNRVLGYIVVNESLDEDTINQKLDYEAYDTLFLVIKLVDRNTVVGLGEIEDTLVIQIGDVNDNEPFFVEGTLQQERFVMEEANTSTIIGAVTASHLDGPKFNKITYSLIPENPDHEGLISIDASTGMLTVDARDKVIDCDIPVTFDIPLRIFLADQIHKVNDTLAVKIIDKNNKTPFFTNETAEVKIFEKAEAGTEIIRLGVEDFDRDEPFHTVAFELDFKTFPELGEYFEVRRYVDETGTRMVQAGVVLVKENHLTLDRDLGQDRFTVPVKVHDNPNSSGVRNQNSTLFTLILLDINDHDPILPELGEIKLNETTQQGTAIERPLEANDLDDRNTENAKVNYVLNAIRPAGGNSQAVLANDEIVQNLFALQQLDEYTAQLLVGHNLEGFYGKWELDVQAFDRGDEYPLIPDGPKRSHSRTYTIMVSPFNYMAPVIDAPTEEERIRLRFESLTNGRPLINTQGKQIPNFAATDTDGGDFGVVTFSLQSQSVPSEDHLYFQLVTIDDHHAQLVLANANAVEARSYRVMVNAKDGGDREAAPVNIVIAFINMTGQPEFREEDSPFSTDFTENEDGMDEVRIIPQAIDPKNAELPPEDHVGVYYHIDTKYGNASHLFQLGVENRELRLTEELDREDIPSHEIRIVATNSRDPPTVSHPSDSRSLLLVQIKVNDVNDNPPTFLQRSYSAGITVRDYSGKLLLTVEATDPDEDDVISYTIDSESLQAHGSNLPVSPIPFALDKDNGKLTLDLQITVQMKGFYTFDVVATDLVGHTDTVPVKVYLIAETNRVTFVFLNSVTDIETPETRNYLQEQFGLHYNMSCNIDDVVRGSISSDSKDASTDRVTEVRAHFIRDDEAVEAAEIQQRSLDRVFVTNLKTELSKRQLFLQDVPVTAVESFEEKNELLQTILIVVASALGILCVILVVAFCIKIRSLNRQVKAMTATDFGSITSDINTGRRAPTTNIFSVEGSNPVLNGNDLAKGAFDDVSVQSYESDFVGIDNDLFINKNQENLNPKLIEEITQKSPYFEEHKAAAAEPPARSTKNENNDELTHRF